jgi:hypothetical protein
MLDEIVGRRVKDALHRQKYNLLLGAEISLDSDDSKGDPLLSAEKLRGDLCHITESRSNSPLWRVAGLLDDEQISQKLTHPFSDCRPGPTVKALAGFA